MIFKYLSRHHHLHHLPANSVAATNWGVASESSDSSPTRVNSRLVPQSHVGEKMWKKSPRYQTCTHTEATKESFPFGGHSWSEFVRFFRKARSRRRKKTRKFEASTCTAYHAISVQLSSPPRKIFSYRLHEASRWLSFCGRQPLHKVPQFNEKIIFSTLSSHKSLICGSGRARLMLTQSEHEVLRLCPMRLCKSA